MAIYQFPITSRYYDVPTTSMTAADGRTIVHLRRRFLPDPARFALLQFHTVSQGERPDLIAAQYLSAPDAAWRIADANGVMNPDELTASPGKRLRITLPEGIPGTSNA
jgi:hypothetical protein